MARHIPGGIRYGRPVFEITRKFKKKKTNRSPKAQANNNVDAVSGNIKNLMPKNTPENNTITETTTTRKTLTTGKSTTIADVKAVEKNDVVNLDNVQNPTQENTTNTITVSDTSENMSPTVTARNKKAEILEYATLLGLEVTDDMTKKEMLDAIEGTITP